MTASWGFVPYSFFGVVALAIALDLWLYRTRDGLTTRAVGLDDTSARRVGVSANIRFLRAFLLSSLFACAGGLFLAALVGIGDPRLGTSFTLPTLAAAVLGGAALGGGRGSFIGAVNGALFLTLIINVLPFLGWPAAWGDIARGACHARRPGTLQGPGAVADGPPVTSASRGLRAGFLMPRSPGTVHPSVPSSSVCSSWLTQC